VGQANINTLDTADHGVRHVPCFAIMTKMRDLFGIVTDTLLRSYHDRLRRPADPAATLDVLLSAQRDLHRRLANAGQPLSDFEKRSTLALHLAGRAEAAALSTFTIAYPAPAQQTFEHLGAHLRAQAPQATLSGTGFAVLVAGAPPRDFAATIAHAVDIAVGHALAARGDNARHHTAPAAIPLDSPTHYCYVHGHEMRHSGSSCHKLGSETTHVAAKGAARSPTDVPAGVPPGNTSFRAQRNEAQNTRSKGA